MSDFYDHAGYPATGASGASAAMRAELDAIAAGFAKLAALTGNGSKFLRVNSGGTAYEAIDGPTLVTALFANVISPTQITSNQNDYNPTSLSTATAVRISTDASRDVTGLQGGAAGRVLLLINAGSFNAVLKAESASSSAANRFALTYDLTLLPGWMALLWYDSTSSRWRAQGLQASAFIQTLLDDADAGAALTTLINGATEDTAPDKIADFLGSYDASGTTGKKLRIITALARAMPFGQGLLINGKISTSVSSNALTIAVKTDAGSDPSSTDPVYALFRKSTLTDSGFDIVPITGALSTVISSGSTGGHASGVACHIFVYLGNDSGTAKLFWSNLPPDYPGVFGKARLVSTTAEGGLGAADSATGVYSTAAMTNVPWICVAKMLSTQATAGTWASAMTQVDASPFTLPSCNFRATGAILQLLATATATKLSMGTELFDPDSTYDTTNYRHQPNVAGYYEYDVAMGWAPPAATYQYYVAIYKNGTEVNRQQFESAGTNFVLPGTTARVLMNGTTDYVECYGYQNSGGNSNVDISDQRWAHNEGGRATQ